jgi:hypothetical protein
MLRRWNYAKDRNRVLHRRRGDRRTKSFGTPEVLESRCLLSTFTWANNADGAFNVAANWKDQNGNPGVPGPNDTAQINFSGITVTVPSSIAVNDLTDTATLHIASGATFTLANNAANSTIGPLVLDSGGGFKVTGGTTTRNGTSTAAGTFDVAPGVTLAINGTLSANAGVSLSDTGLYEVTNGTLTVNTPLSVANFAMTGGTQNGTSPFTITTFSWMGGALDGSSTTNIPSGATLSLNGAGTKYLTGGHILNNQGTGTWTGTGEFDGSPGSTFNNSGTFTASSDTDFGNGGAGG